MVSQFSRLVLFDTTVCDAASAGNRQQTGDIMVTYVLPT